MKIKINRYMLSYEGKIYKAGDEVEIQDSNLAKKLVAQSKGNFEILHSDHSEKKRLKLAACLKLILQK